MTNMENKTCPYHHAAAKTSEVEEATSSSPKSSTLPKANAFTAVAAVAIYGYMFVVFLCFWGFLLPERIFSFAPYKFETSTVAPSVAAAVLIDIALLMAFIIPHSTLARTSIKAKMNIPESFERPFFVLQTTIIMHLQMIYYRELPDTEPIWNVSEDSPFYWVLLVGFAFGFLFLFSATFALDHFWLFGLSQGTGVDLNKMIGLAATDSADGFVVRWHYSLCAHPIMTGMFFGLWSTPVMTAGHLIFASVNSAWMLGAIRYLEEPQLKEIIGKPYVEYLESVPTYAPTGCPFTGKFFKK